MSTGTASSAFRQAAEAAIGPGMRVFRAPGRVNLIGEHTDYNDGFVMPAAIGFYTWIAIKAAAGTKLTLASADFNEQVEIELSTGMRPRDHWSDYPAGVARTLLRAGKKIRGGAMYIQGEVPIGSGLSSSAAIEVATALALLTVAQEKIDRREIAQLCQQAENEFVGARCGIMDQFISANGHEGQALMLDCRSLEYRLLPIPRGMSLVICNSMVKHSIAGGEYNERRGQCEAGVAAIRRHLPQVRALRDVTAEQLEQHKASMPEVVYRRCRHVISENARVERAAAALKSGDVRAFGRLMGESHASLRDDYEVSCRELDILVEIADAQPGIVGARMTGGGFGGCTVNLVESGQAEAARERIAIEYHQRTGTHPDIYVCTAAEGAEEVSA